MEKIWKLFITIWLIRSLLGQICSYKHIFLNNIDRHVRELDFLILQIGLEILFKKIFLDTFRIHSASFHKFDSADIIRFFLLIKLDHY